jgi:hypothetical protein
MEIKRLWTTFMATKNIADKIDNAELTNLCYKMNEDFKIKSMPNYYDRQRYNCFIEYKDDPNMMGLAKESINFLKDYLFELYEETSDEYKIEIQGWSMIQGWGNHLLCHNHIGHHMVAVYYVNVPEVVNSPTPNSGALVLYNPDPINRGWMTKGPKNKDGLINVINVKAGDLVLFPGYVNHSVNPWYGEKERVSIAMNFYVRRKNIYEPMILEEDLYK